MRLRDVERVGDFEDVVRDGVELFTLVGVELVGLAVERVVVVRVVVREGVVARDGLVVTLDERDVVDGVAEGRVVIVRDEAREGVMLRDGVEVVVVRRLGVFVMAREGVEEIRFVSACCGAFVLKRVVVPPKRLVGRETLGFVGAEVLGGVVEVSFPCCPDVGFFPPVRCSPVGTEGFVRSSVAGNPVFPSVSWWPLPAFPWPPFCPP